MSRLAVDSLPFRRLLAPITAAEVSIMLAAPSWGTAEEIAEGKYVTYDLKPDRNDPTAVGTQEMAEAICGFDKVVGGWFNYGLK